jgi:hypothetical protein
MHYRIRSFQVSFSLRTLLVVLVGVVTTLTSCISLEEETEEASPLSMLKIDSAIVDDNFSMIYCAPKGAKELAPVAVYTFNFWTPTFLNMHSRTSNLCR